MVLAREERSGEPDSPRGCRVTGKNWDKALSKFPGSIILVRTAAISPKRSILAVALLCASLSRGET
jgi:hypothetical protein